LVRFPEEEAHHILHVVRLKAGDRCRVVDGRGGRFVVRLEGRGKDLFGAVLESERDSMPLRRLDLGFPMLRTRSRTDWLIEKGVEVGVGRFVPIEWARSLKPASTGSKTRWERIIAEAMKQSERLFLPDLAPAQEALVAVAEADVTILADSAGVESLPDLGAAESVLLLVGPEGGIAPEERDALVARGAVLWGLGPGRLRAETAAIVGSHRLACALLRAGSSA
jgi:16S rRNA (uracil1498-N3)-methyltransferase